MNPQTYSYISGMVSVLTPTYNYGHYIGCLLESVLAQDYPLVEMIVVDDGSTDDTPRVIESFRERFASRGYILKHITQSNGGQSSAIRNGLKHIEGEFLVWPDADDWYSSPPALSTMASTLVGAPSDVGAVRCLPTYGGDEQMAGVMSKTPFDTHKDRLFEDAVTERPGFRYISGGYMVRMGCLDRCIPKREIAVARHAGQNYQLMLPLLYHFRCLTIEQQLITIRCHVDSHSLERYSGYRAKATKFDDFRKVMEQTLQNIPEIPKNELHRLLKLQSLYFLKLKLRVAEEMNEIKEVRHLCREIGKLDKNSLSRKDKRWCLVAAVPFSKYIIRLYKKFKS